MRDEIMRSAADFSGYVQGTSDDAKARVFAAEGLDVAWESVDSSEDVIVWCAIGELAQKPAAELTDFLLQANCFGDKTAGGHLGLYAPSRSLIYSYRFAPSSDVPTTAGILQSFVAKALQLVSEAQALQSSLATEDGAMPDSFLPV